MLEFDTIENILLEGGDVIILDLPYLPCHQVKCGTL